jgi:RNA polymerase sigma-70 factor (ECF subfamily)
MSKFADIQIDPAIVKRAARGDSRAHEIIYRAFSAPVYSLCLRFTKVPAQAEDLVQETFIEIMRSIAKFRGEAALGSWIRRIAVSKALMYLRSAWTAAMSAGMVFRAGRMMRSIWTLPWQICQRRVARLSGCTTWKVLRTRRSLC